ncbi:MAG: helix-turn-helix domain-containing protein [Nanoarchaeota archaeon]
MIKETLKSLGMTKNEVEIYLTLLNAGELSVNEIGSKSGLHRQVCYDALDRLLEKGFVSYVNRNNKKYFRPLYPEKILDYLEEKKNQVKSILPELKVMYSLEKEETFVEVVKGRNVIRTVYNDIFRILKKQGGDLLIMGVEEGKFLKFDSIAIRQHILRMKKNNLKEKILTKESARIFYEGKQSEYRMIPDSLFNPTPTHIYGDKIAIVIWGHPAYGIIIKNKQVADANRKYFQILWKTAKKK